MHNDVRQFFLPRPHRGWLAAIALFLAACSTHQNRPRARYVPLTEIESVFGPIIMAGNQTTANQMGTGDRLGLFRDRVGTIWGLPLAIMAEGTVVGCALPAVRQAQVTDSTRQGQPLLVPRMSQPAGAAVLANWNSSCETHREESNGEPFPHRCGP